MMNRAWPMSVSIPFFEDLKVSHAHVHLPLHWM